MSWSIVETEVRRNFRCIPYHQVFVVAYMSKVAISIKKGGGVSGFLLGTY